MVDSATAIAARFGENLVKLLEKTSILPDRVLYTEICVHPGYPIVLEINGQEFKAEHVMDKETYRLLVLFITLYTHQMQTLTLPITRIGISFTPQIAANIMKKYLSA